MHMLHCPLQTPGSEIQRYGINTMMLGTNVKLGRAIFRNISPNGQLTFVFWDTVSRAPTMQVN